MSDDSLERGRISYDTRRRIAEAIHHDDLQTVADQLFRVVIGRAPEDYEPYRTVRGSVPTNKSVTITATNGEQSETAVSADGSDEYLLELPDGTWSLTASADDAAVSMSSESVEIDTKTTDIGTVDGPEVRA